VAAEGDKRLSRPSLALPALGTGAAVALGGAAVGLGLAVALQAAGPLGAVAFAVAVLAVVLLRFPEISLAVLLIGAGLIEVESSGLIPPFESFYDVVGASLTPQDVLLLLGIAGVLLRFAVDGERPRLPEPLTIPLALLGVAVAGGVVSGYYATPAVSNGELFHRGLTALYLIGVPLLAVNVLRDARSLKIFAGLAAALAALKGVSGIYTAIGGSGAAVEEETISYLNPVPNLLMLLFVLGVTAALVRKVRLPTWMYAMAPVAMLALILSYRRSFWIAAALTIVLVVIIASRRRGRAVALITAALVAMSLAAVALVGSSDPSGESPLVTRAKTITPGGLGSNRGDRYRIDERKSVIVDISEDPLTGIGIGVPWKVHYPLAEEHDRRYAHVATLWYWLSMGILGLCAYLAIFGVGLWTAFNVWRRHRDAQIRIAALAAFGGLVGMLVVELTATFTGVEPRTSLIIGGLLGWLAAAWADLPDDEPEHPAHPQLRG
jgi:O-antigen ligase